MGRVGLVAALFGTLLSAAPATAAWVEARTAHFTVIGDGKPGEIEKMATELEQFDSVVRLFHAMPSTEESRANPLTVFVVKSTDAIRKYCRGCPTSVAGFYSGRASGSYAWTPRLAGDGGKLDLKPRQVLFHEYGHHLLLSNTALAYPAWFSEGYAEFLATMKPTDKGFEVGHPPLYRAWSLLRVPLPAKAMFEGGARSRDGWTIDALYGRGWLLTHMTMFDKARRDQLMAYLRAINDGKPSLAAAEAAFGDLNELDRALNRYLNAKTLKVMAIAADRIAAPRVTAKALNASQAAMIEFRMQSRAGVNEKTAAPLFARASAAAAKLPDDPQVHGWLAEMALDAKEPATAIALAERALAVEPEQAQALLYLAKARMALIGQGKGSAADWAAVRAPIVKANRSNPNSAEPLLLYYRSYLDQGRSPPKIAVEGLLRAAQLAPQDSGLRMTTVRQLALDDRLPEAARLLRPLAYNPHTPPDGPAAQLMTALMAGKKAEAVAILDKKPDEPAPAD